MTTEELEALLQGGRETPTLDFKAPCAWSCNTFVKDILAMANVLDGGYIVVGVDDATFERRGLSDAEIASFCIDTMRDQVGPFADPFVDFHSETVSDSQGQRYVVISIRPFDEIPVLCKKDGKDVNAGRMYYRPSNGRIQSSAVNNSHDMRAILEVAIARRLARLRRIGVIGAESGIDEALDRELGDL